MENSQAEISQPPWVQKSPLEEAMNELAKSQSEFANFQAQFMNETREILQIKLEQLKSSEIQVDQMDKILST